tara:strand:- start:3532 stop:4128 length:597 start_codon:yes stop_codon:yes gene_type:complete
MNRIIYITEDIRSTSGDYQRENSLIRRVFDDVNYLNLLGKDPIHVFIDTDGGNLKTALSIFDILRLSKAPIYTYALSEVSSAGTVIYLAGDKRFAFTHSQFMMHESSLSVGGSKKDFEYTAAQCLEQNAKVFPIFNSRIKMGKRKFDKLHEHSNYLWAEEAKKHKMVTEILTEMPNHLIKASMEYALEPIALEMKFDE